MKMEAFDVIEFGRAARASKLLEALRVDKHLVKIAEVCAGKKGTWVNVTGNESP
jgi:hypothetical protein